MMGSRRSAGSASMQESCNVLMRQDTSRRLRTRENPSCLPLATVRTHHRSPAQEMAAPPAPLGHQVAAESANSTYDSERDGSFRVEPHTSEHVWVPLGRRLRLRCGGGDPTSNAPVIKPSPCSVVVSTLARISAPGGRWARPLVGPLGCKHGTAIGGSGCTAHIVRRSDALARQTLDAQIRPWRGRRRPCSERNLSPRCSDSSFR